MTGQDAASVPAGRANLAARAARALAASLRAAGRSAVRIEIRKRIPVAAGLAGGSADAAAALVACNELWGRACTPAELREVAAGVGSDVPFALLGGTAIGQGRGERLTAALAAGTYHWVLAFASGGLSTPEVYAACDRLRAAAAAGHDAADGAEPALSTELMAALRSGDPAAVGPLLSNDLQPAARLAAPGPAPGAGRGPGVRGARRDRLRFRPHLRLSRRERRARPGPRGLADRCRGVPGRGPGSRARPRAPRWSRRSRMSPVQPLVTLEAATKAYGPRVLLERGVARGGGRGPDRRRRPQRRGQDHAAPGAGRAGPTWTPAAPPGPATSTSATCRRPRTWPARCGEMVFGSLPEHEWAADARSRSVIAALLPGIDLQAPAQRMSGGERRRVALAALLRRAA